MARLTRHELKTDELGNRLAALTQFFYTNWRRISLSAGGVLVLLGLAGGIFFYVRAQQQRAAEAFAKALSTYHAPVTPESPNIPSLVTYKTEEEKNTEALRQLADVADSYSRYRAGKMARYYAALCQRDLGKLEDAEKQLSSVAAEGDESLAAMAKMALAGVYQQMGRAADAEKLYRELEGRPTVAVPKAAVQIALAELYLRTNPPQAVELYKQMEKDYAGTAAGDLASQMLEKAPP